MNSRKFFVCLDEITQNFVFGERFSGSYTQTVILSNGSTRTVKLTPMVHDTFGEVVELNDSGHISYMGPNGTTTNGNLMVALRELPMLYPDEKSCAAAIVSAPIVRTLYATLGTDPQIITARVHNLGEQPDNPHSDHVLMADSAARPQAARLASHLPAEFHLLCGLLMHGTPAVKAALTPSAGRAVDVLFRVAHQETESALQARWPAPDEQTGKVLLFNDPFTQMITVTDSLQSFFGMNPESATRAMLEIHESGVSMLELAPGSNVSDACRQLNVQWRARDLPLYCAPQRRDPTRSKHP